MLTRRRGRSQRAPDPLANGLSRSPGAPLSNDVAVSDSDNSTGTSTKQTNDGGVLANLPRARPQRSSPRRAAARRNAGAAAARNGATAPPASKRTRAKTAGAAPVKSGVKPLTGSAASATAKRETAAKRAKPAGAASKRRPARAAGKARQGAHEEAAPRQGFECDGEARGARCSRRGALSSSRRPPRSSASSPRPGCRGASASSRTCSRACRSDRAACAALRSFGRFT